MNTETVNKNQELEKLVAGFLGIPVPAQFVTTQNPPSPSPSPKPRPQINFADVNKFGSCIGEEREIVIKYKVGHEKDAEAVINGDAYRCMEDSLAAAYGVGRLIQASTGKPNTADSGIPYQKVAQKIIATILDAVTEEMIRSISSIAKVVREN